MKTDTSRERALRIDRFMRLPRRSGETWQGGGVLLPFFRFDCDAGDLARQAAIAWANLATDEVLLVSAAAEEARDHERLLDAFLDLGLKNRKVREGRPARVEVSDEALGAFLKHALGDGELDIAVVPALDRIDAEIGRIVEAETGEVQIPGVLDAPGVTLDRLRAFAGAAAACRAREIWHDIASDDLVLVESPAPPDGMAGFVADFGDGSPSIRFYSSREEFDLEEEHANHEGDEDFDDEGEFDGDDEFDDAREPLEEGWHVEFVHLQELPVLDVSPWADHGLPVAGADGYPVAVKPEGERGFTRPDATRLAFLEGLLRVLGGTTEAEIDSGRWSRTVDTSDGPVTYQLTLPSLIEEASGGSRRAADEQGVAVLSRFLEEGQFETLQDAMEELKRRGIKQPKYVEPTSPEEKAQDLVFSSMGAPGRRRKQLLRQAVSTWPDCFQAYLQLAEIETRSDHALELFHTGRAAAERAIGQERLRELEGRYWDDPATRQYLRLRMGLALTLRNIDRLVAAVTELREMLDFDETDRAGAREYLLSLLLELGRDGEAAHLLERFDDGGSTWRYGAALLAYRQGDRRTATARLLDAYGFNPLAAEFLVAELLGPEAATGLGPRDSEVTHEAEADAEECLDQQEEAWDATPGAAEWMASELKRARRRGQARRSPRRR